MSSATAGPGAALKTTPKTTALAGWFGANRILAAEVGCLLNDCPWVCVPFAGGMSELLHITARTLIVNDRHRHIINLARVVADPVLGPRLYRELRRLPFHPDILAEAQANCRGREETSGGLFGGTKPRDGDRPDWLRLSWARDYFVCCWMGRGGTAGTPGEFTGSMSVRYDAGGGDSATRFRSAVSGLPAWRRVLSRCTFLNVDAFELLETVKDQPGHGLYIDAPWPDAGDGYTHAFSESDQRRLARALSRFRACKVVARYGDHPLIRELYPESDWLWRRQTSRTQANKGCAEALIVKRREA